MKKIILVIILLFFLSLQTGCTKNNVQTVKIHNNSVKMYWFIPDGMRADPELINIFEWADKGELPNIKKMMDKGSFGYSIPTFPSHTPTNFATLLTGVYPDKHGVADGPMHIEGRPLNSVAVGGFSSAAKKVDPIWTTLEKEGNKVLLLSMPGSTPPELDIGITLRGRWGGWGADFHALNFESAKDLKQRKNQGRGNKLFFFGPELTQYINTKNATGWSLNPLSFSTPLEIELSGWGSKLYGFIYDSTNDDSVNYNRILFSEDKKNMIGTLKQGDWSEWENITLNWNNIDVESNVIINLIKLDDDGFFRIRLFYDNLNDYNVQPSYVAGEFEETLGPMVDFVDNFPPQLIYYPEDKQTFLEEMNMSFEWHTKAIPFIINNYDSEIIIHDIYSPNQMLTSRWWLGYIDPSSSRYDDVNGEQREVLLSEVKSMYKRLDLMVGEILDNSNEDTYIILSSDHGAVPLDKWVRLNNLFAKRGWLKFKINSETGEPIIDWKNSKVIYLKMDNIYVHPDGLEGNWTRGSGEEYEKLRNEVITALLELKDIETNKSPVKAVVKWENVRQYLDLPEDRVGDLVVANEAGYGWNEEMSEDLEIFSIPLKSGYKQAIFANETKGMWTPFIIVGPGIKKGYFIETPIDHVDQYTTIMKLLNYGSINQVDGKVLYEIIN